MRRAAAAAKMMLNTSCIHLYHNIRVTVALEQTERVGSITRSALIIGQRHTESSRDRRVNFYRDSNETKEKINIDRLSNITGMGAGLQGGL